MAQFMKGNRTLFRSMKVKVRRLEFGFFSILKLQQLDFAFAFEF